MSTQIQTLSYEDLERFIKTKEVSYFNFYNVDIPITTYYAIQYYLRHQHDTIDNQQPLNKMFLDIELYGEEDGVDDFSLTQYPINAVTFCCNTEKVLRSYYLLNDQNYQKFGIQPIANFDLQSLLNQHIQNFTKFLIKEGYIDDTFKFEIRIFNEEAQMLQAFWLGLHDVDPDILSGWNCIRKDQSIWCKDRIINIGDAYQDLEIFKYGTINKFKISPVQHEYELKLVTGQTIITSENHRFPVFLKERDKYKNPNRYFF